MFETMSIYSLVLMTTAALLFPPAFRHLPGVPRAVLLKSSMSLWTVTLPFAALTWYLAAVWAQTNRPPLASFALITSSLGIFLVTYAALPFKPRPGLGPLSLTFATLLGYAALSWIIKSLFAAVASATLDMQALMFGYLMLCPALAAALTPRPRPVASSLFVVLTSLLLYAIGAWATSALWGTTPALPAWMQPIILIFVSLFFVAVLTWIMWQVDALPLLQLAVAYLIAVGRFLVELVAALGLPAFLLVLNLARWLFRTVRWIILELIPAAGEEIAVGSVALLRWLWRTVQAVPTQFYNIVVGIGNSLVSAIIWLVTVVSTFGRALVAVTHAIGKGCVRFVRYIPRRLGVATRTLWNVSIWLTTVVVPNIARTFWHIFLLLSRALIRACIWSISKALPRFARWLVSLARSIERGMFLMAREMTRGLGALAHGVAEATVWVARTLLPRLAHRFIALAYGLMRLVTVTPRILWRVGVWLVTVLVPGIARGILEIFVAMASGFIALVQGIWHDLWAPICRLGRALLSFPGVLITLLTRLALGCRQGAVWLASVFVPAVALGLLAAWSEIGRGITLMAYGTLHVIRAAVNGPIRAVVWLLNVALPSAGRILAVAARVILHTLSATASGLAYALIWLVTAAPVALARKTLIAARIGLTWLFELGRAFRHAVVWTVTVLLPGIPKACMTCLQQVAKITRDAIRGVGVQIITTTRALILAIRAAPRDILALVLPALGRIPIPVVLTSALAFVTVVAIALVGPIIASAVFASPPPALRIAAGSNFKPLEPILLHWGSENQVDVQVTYRGSLDIESSLKDGSVQYDAIWEGDSLWMAIGDPRRLLKDSHSIMCSPVVLGIKKSLAERLGWIENIQVRLADILTAAESSKLRVFMANPTKSNSGALAYFRFLDSFASNPGSVTRLLGRMDRTSDSSGWLRDLCRDQYGRCDAMINYESLILELNQEVVTRGQEPMYLVYPSDGLGLADFPLSFVSQSNAEKEPLFLRLEAYLQSDAVQGEIAKLGNRVGARCDRVNDTIFKREWGANPARMADPVHPEKPVIDETLTRYRTSFRKPSLTIYLLDFSSSMQGARRDQMQKAMRMVLNQQEAAKYSLQGSLDDVTVVIPFAGRTLNDDDIRNWIVAGSDTAEFDKLLNRIQNQPTADLTNIYMPVAKALALMKEEDVGNYMPAIILLTDGESNRGSIDDVRNALAESGLYNVPIFGITFGDASPQQLNDLAGLTGGRVFDGTRDLIDALRQAKAQN